MAAGKAHPTAPQLTSMIFRAWPVRSGMAAADRAGAVVDEVVVLRHARRAVAASTRQNALHFNVGLIEMNHRALLDGRREHDSLSAGGGLANTAGLPKIGTPMGDYQRFLGGSRGRPCTLTGMTPSSRTKTILPDGLYLFPEPLTCMCSISRCAFLNVPRRLFPKDIAQLNEIA